MKKILSAALVLVMTVLFAAGAAAEGIDLSAMSLEELRILQQDVEAEIRKREAAGGTIEPWAEEGIASHVPKPRLLSGEEPELSRELDAGALTLYVTVKNGVIGDYDAYVSLLIEFGYTNVIDRNSSTFEAMNAEGYKVYVLNFGTGHFAVTCISPIPGSDVPAVTQKDEDSIEGTWDIVAVSDTEDEEIVSIHAAIKAFGGTWTLTFRDGKMTMHLEVLGQEQNEEFTYELRNGKLVTNWANTLDYTLDGDSLVIYNETKSITMERVK